VAATGFQSILFPDPGGAVGESAEEPDYFVDLNLDQVLQSMAVGREEYALSPFFYTPVREVAVVRYRHGVLRDLERPEVLDVVRKFAERMRRMRAHLEQAGKLRHELQAQAWFVDAVAVYCELVGSLSTELSHRELSSDGMRGFRDYLAEYVASECFASLVLETEAVKRAAATVRYSVRTQGGKVTVTKYQDDPDYSAEVQETFARFRQRAVSSHLVRLFDEVAMNHVEARILDGVAELYADVFEQRRGYCGRHRDFLDTTIARFDRESQFYLAYLELIDRVRGAGLPVCYPQVSTRSKEVAAADTFDLALANKLVGDGRRVVCNDFHLQESERVFVVSGPNNGGKTTFARTFGQLHHLAGLGLLVPGREARLLLPDRIYSHFEREEDIETLRGKFDDELVRVHEILKRASSNSIIVMNESFNSTTLEDALVVGTEVMRRILDLGALGVYVTFVDEIASLSDATVSMVTQIVPENPAERTFKLLRRPADGLAYAWAIAEKHGLTYQRVMERIRP
jgi:DNA mismatch repair protein MutS